MNWIDRMMHTKNLPALCQTLQSLDGRQETRTGQYRQHWSEEKKLVPFGLLVLNMAWLTVIFGIQDAVLWSYCVHRPGW